MSKYFLEVQTKVTIEMQPSLWWNITPAVTVYCIVLHGDYCACVCGGCVCMCIFTRTRTILFCY